MQRREMMRLGLEGSLAMLFAGTGSSVPQESTRDYSGSAVHSDHPLEFRLDGAYRPDLSDEAARRLAGVTLAFIGAEHAKGMKVTFWNLTPKEMPFLGRHLELVVEHAFRGIRDNLQVRPVDPIAILSLLYNESRFHPKVISPAGAAGMAQFMPDTAIQFELEPVARLELWKRYREARQQYRRDRRKRRRSFQSRYSLRGFDADVVMRRAVDREDLEILSGYLAIADEDDPSKAILQEYLDGLEADFEAHSFFWSGQEALGKIDGRVSYRAVEKAVRYIALQLADYQGMVSTAMAAYNAGPDAVRVRSKQSILHRFGDIPNYAETIKYVQRFLAVYAAIKHRLYEAY